jgi:hypothetical protein
MFSAIFAGVASLAGAYLTRRDAKKEAARVAAANRAEAARIQRANEEAARRAQKQNTQVRQNYYKNVVSDAQSAGINPLTALRTGGGAGYATAVAGTMTNPVMAEGVFITPTLSRNPLAAGMEAATNTYLSELTRQKQYTHESRMDELQASLIRAQIKGMTAELGRNKGAMGTDEEIKIMGAKIEQDPNTTNVEIAEERYGDVVSTLVGIGVLAADARATAAVLMHNEATSGFDAARRRKPIITRSELPFTGTRKGSVKRGEMRGAY